MYITEDQEIAEHAIENALQVLRMEGIENLSKYKRNRARSIVRVELDFLKQCFPDSYALKLDISDIDLTLE